MPLHFPREACRDNKCAVGARPDFSAQRKDFESDFCKISARRALPSERVRHRRTPIKIFE